MFDCFMQNIFVVSKNPWHVKIGDFGISKHIDDATALHTSILSLGYAAPEIEDSEFGMRDKNNEYTNAVNIWSLGCEMLTGKVPFSSRDQLADFYHLRTLFPTDPLVAKGVGHSVRDFLRVLIKPGPSHRLDAQAALRLSWIPITDPQVLGELLRDESTQPAGESPFNLENRNPPSPILECCGKWQ